MANVIVVSETPQRVIIRDEAATRTVKVVAQGPQGPTGTVNPQMITLRDEAQAAATAASSDAATSSANAGYVAINAANAEASATTASTKAGEAIVSAGNAATSAVLAQDWAIKTVGPVSGAEYSSKYHAQAASASAGSASSSATAAAASATTASTKAGEASASAASALDSKDVASVAAQFAVNAQSAAQTSANAALASKNAAATSATDAAGSATASAGSATAASGSAASASGSASTATTKASEAATSATNAAASATTASTKASEASTSATNAAASASAAATSATNTANALVGERSAVATLTNKTITGGTVNPTTLQEGGVDAVIQSDIGTEPNQIPLNQYLGPLAYRDENPAGAVVGTTAVQVLSGKSFSDNLLFTGNAVVGVNSLASSMFIGGGGTLPDNVTYQAASNHIWQVGGVERARISSSGRVGVGTTSPQGQIVASNAGAEGLEIDSVAVAGASRIMAYNRSALAENALQLRASAIVMLTGGTERLRLDASGNLGLGAVPSAWRTGYKAVETAHGSFSTADNTTTRISLNAYFATAGWLNRNTGNSLMFELVNGGGFQWQIAPSAAAGAAPTFTQAMTLDASGNLLVGRTAKSSGGKLEVGGNVVCQPSAAAPTLGTNGDMSFQLVSDTSLKILVRGSDGVTRSTTLTLA